MQTQILLPNMSGKIDFIGEPVKAVGYNSYKTNKRSNTIGIYTTNFIGRIWIQGSLKDNPINKLDWFVIPLSNNTPYIEFDNYKDNLNVNRDNRFININGSYVWLRCILDRRSYLDVLDSPVKPYDIHTSYVLTAGVNVDPYTTNAPYKTTPLNPKDDPEYYPEWIPNYKQSYQRGIVSSKMGNVEKVMLCY
jgi:hypothetical protein